MKPLIWLIAFIFCLSFFLRQSLPEKHNLTTEVEKNCQLENSTNYPISAIETPIQINFLFSFGQKTFQQKKTITPVIINRQIKISSLLFIKSSSFHFFIKSKSLFLLFQYSLSLLGVILC